MLGCPSVGQYVGLFVSWSVIRSVSRSVGQSFGRLVGRSVDRSVGLMYIRLCWRNETFFKLNLVMILSKT